MLADRGRRHIGNRLASMRLLAVCWIALAGPLFSTAPLRAQASQQTPVATVGGEPLYEADYLMQVRTQIYKTQLQEYTIRKKALDEAINQKLLQAEAVRLGMKEGDLLQQEADSKIKPPTDEEVEENFVRLMFRGGGNLTKEHVREQLLQQIIGEARDAFYQKLRARAGVMVLLSPPRMPVTYDPERVRGSSAAKITMIEFTDFQCPYCLQAYTTVKNLLRKYDGKVKLAFRDLPLREADEGGVGPADAARCAWEQGKFWEYHDLLFEKQDRGEGVFSEYAEQLQLNLEQFDSCMQSGKYRAQVQADFREAVSLAIPGTPFFYINGIPLNGARPQPEFEEIIEAELARLEMGPED
ncbi:MAG: thioredoxin domain-containing protein [Acidobacteria bacterium]|nr:thioredoxin domain-containing protein [Acidobacteriota bacterium]